MDVAVYVTAALGGFLLIVAGAFSSGGHRDWSIWASCVAAVCFVVSGFCWYQDKVWTQDATKASKRTTSGTVFPAQASSDPVPPDGSSGPLNVLLGETSRATITGSHLAIARQGEEDLLAVDRKDGRLRISGNLYGPNGALICTIIDNHFDLKQPEFFDVDNGPFRFAIKDSSGNAILTIEYLDDHTIRVEGDIVGHNGRRVEIRPDHVQVGGARHEGATFVFKAPKAIVFGL